MRRYGDGARDRYGDGPRYGDTATGAHGRQDGPDTPDEDEEPPAPADRVANLLAANKGSGAARDPEGMGAARSWRPWP